MNANWPRVLYDMRGLFLFDSTYRRVPSGAGPRPKGAGERGATRAAFWWVPEPRLQRQWFSLPRQQLALVAFTIDPDMLKCVAGFKRLLVGKPEQGRTFSTGLLL